METVSHSVWEIRYPVYYYLRNHLSQLLLNTYCILSMWVCAMCLHVQRVWDELDQWHSRITELEAEVQELAEEQPERAHILMDELTKPLQLYQFVAKQAEQRTAFMNRVSTVTSFPAIIQ